MSPIACGMPALRSVQQHPFYIHSASLNLITFSCHSGIAAVSCILSPSFRFAVFHNFIRCTRPTLAICCFSFGNGDSARYLLRGRLTSRAPPTIQKTPFARVIATLQRPRSVMKPASSQYERLSMEYHEGRHTDIISMLRRRIHPHHEGLLPLRGIDGEVPRVRSLRVELCVAASHWTRAAAAGGTA